MAAGNNGPTRRDNRLTALQQLTANGDERLAADHGSLPSASDADPSFDTVEAELASKVRRTAHVAQEGLAPATNMSLDAAVERASHPTETDVELTKTQLRSQSDAPIILRHSMPNLKDSSIARMGENQAWAAMMQLMRQGSPSLVMTQLAERPSTQPSHASLPVDPTHPIKRTSPENRARQPSGLFALKAVDRLSPDAPPFPSVDLLAGSRVRPEAMMAGPTPTAQRQDHASRPITSDGLAEALRPIVQRWLNDTMPSVLEQAIRLETKAHRD